MVSLMRDRLIVGLDVADIGQAEKLVEKLADTINFYKSGKAQPNGVSVDRQYRQA